MATHSSILAWEIPWTEGPGGPQSMGWQESDTTWLLNHYHWMLSTAIGIEVTEMSRKWPLASRWWGRKACGQEIRVVC